jgi:hypothetical protein
MTKYLDKSFSVAPGRSDAYRDNWDQTFGKKAAEPGQESPLEHAAREATESTNLPRYCDTHQGRHPLGCGVCAESERNMLQAKLVDLQAEVAALKAKLGNYVEFREATTK